MPVAPAWPVLPTVQVMLACEGVVTPEFELQPLKVSAGTV